MFKQILIVFLLLSSFSFSNEARCKSKDECLNIGVYLLKQKELYTAIPFLKKACETGSGRACTYIGVNIPLTYGDYSLSMDYLKKGCLMKNSLGCSYLSEIYMEGKQYKKSLNYANLACNERDYQSCGLVGVFYLKGMGVKENIPLAYNYFKKSCNGKNENSCKIVKILDLAKLNEEKYKEEKKD